MEFEYMLKITIVLVTLLVFSGVYVVLFNSSVLDDIKSFVRNAIFGISYSPSMKVCDRYMDAKLDKNEFYDLILSVDSGQCNYAKFISDFYLNESDFRDMLDDIDPQMAIITKKNCTFYKERLDLVIFANTTDALIKPGDFVNITGDEDILICRHR